MPKYTDGWMIYSEYNWKEMKLNHEGLTEHKIIRIKQSNELDIMEKCVVCFISNPHKQW